MKRHPEMQLIENLRVETLVEEASLMYAKVSPFYFLAVFEKLKLSCHAGLPLEWYKKIYQAKFGHKQFKKGQILQNEKRPKNLRPIFLQKFTNKIQN